MTWHYSVIAGLLIAVVYACATWMDFQCRKQGTLLPRGLISEEYGALISMLLYGICGIALIVSGFLLGWWVVITIVVTWLPVADWQFTLNVSVTLATDLTHFNCTQNGCSNNTARVERPKPGTWLCHVGGSI
jgi:hypothetical protein